MPIAIHGVVFSLPPASGRLQLFLVAVSDGSGLP
ncbi:hypothetical protein MPC4_400019 [Methylocella tundrae]|uniref:Uncharacterized protein n=1 Tax=Methylocella tundrae TaxID=227605 RepID=A0A8B6MC08_METTU|nr:hypothetical protein MPC4_400019 [Methylocella tundrae]